MSDIIDQLLDSDVCSPAQNYCRNHMRMEAAALEIERLRGLVVQAVNVIEEAQEYEQPIDPFSENALTMRELDLFEFDVSAARAAIPAPSTDGGNP